MLTAASPTLDRRSGVPLITTIAVAFVAIGDALAYFGGQSVSGSAIFTAAFAAMCILSLPFIFLSGKTEHLAPLVPFVIFAVWQTVLVVVLGSGIPGIQTVSVLWVFIGVAATTAVFTDDDAAAKVRRRLFIAAIVLGSLYAAVIATGGLGASGIIGRRSFAVEALILIAAAVPFIAKSDKLARFVTYFLALLVVASLSRTALVVAVALVVVRLCLSQRGVRLFRMLVLLGAAVAALFWAIENVPVLRERFTGGDQAFQLGGITLSTQGRDKIWETLITSAQTSPLIGQGPGSARDVIGTALTGQAEAHNDFLRTWHDSGWVGVILLSLALLTLIVAFVRRIRGRGLDKAAPHVGALLATLAFIASAMTDNPIVYTFVMMPLAVVVGLSLRELPVSRFDGSAARRLRSTPRRDQYRYPLPPTSSVRR